MQKFQFKMLMADGSWEPIPDEDPVSRATGEERERPTGYSTKAKHNAYQREWRKTHPLNAEQKHKDSCRSYAGVYLRKGKLKREQCFMCDSVETQMHHPDYGDPLKVVWFCRKHHLDIHRMGL